MKNKYNPFKMLGSWVGALIGFFWAIGLQPKGLCNLIFVGNKTVCLSSGIAYFIIILIGFLIGWGIQSLWRKYK